MTTQTPAPADTKRFAHAQARAAIAGHALHHLPAVAFEPECFVVSWRSLCKSFESLDQVEAWLDRVTGKPA